MSYVEIGRGINAWFLLQLVIFPFTASAAIANHPDTVVRQFYKEIVERRPLGIPTGADKDALRPFFSKRLSRQLEQAMSCEDDYLKQHPDDKDSKPDFGWIEDGLFSGANERALPAAVIVEHTMRQKDGTFRVYVRFTYKESFDTYGRPPDTSATFHLRGAAIVKKESGRFVIDDILLFRDPSSTQIESRLSSSFHGCEGPRWIGR